MKVPARIIAAAGRAMGKLTKRRKCHGCGAIGTDGRHLDRASLAPGAITDDQRIGWPPKEDDIGA